jgi:hypothetical protein
MKNILITFPLFLLPSCTLHASFTPDNDKLNDATVGVPYYGKINIFGGRVVSSVNDDGNERFVGEIYPHNTGLYVQRCENKTFNNCVQIRGIPTTAGMVNVRVSGGFYVAMFQKSSKFDKIYTITIKNPE